MVKEGQLTKEQVIKLLQDSIKLLSKIESIDTCTEKEPNCVKLGEPIVIVGDLHGQFHDLIHMIEKAGDPNEINYLFLGDYVDRGIYGFEVMITLLCIKVSLHV